MLLSQNLWFTGSSLCVFSHRSQRGWGCVICTACSAALVCLTSSVRSWARWVSGSLGEHFRFRGPVPHLLNQNRGRKGTHNLHLRTSLVVLCRRPGFDPWVGKISSRRAWQPTPVFLPGESPWTEEPGGLQFFVGVFSRGTTRISGSLSCGAREVRSPCAWRGGAPEELRWLPRPARRLPSTVWGWGTRCRSGGSKRPASRLERRAESLASPRDEA